MKSTVFKHLLFAPALAISSVGVVTAPARLLPQKVAIKAQPRTTESALRTTRALALQVQLARAGISVGEIDGASGQNTAAALRAFQRARGLTPTGVADTATWRALRTTAPASSVIRIRISRKDIAGPYTKVPAAPEVFSRRNCACYGSALEALAERYHASPALLRRLNPRLRRRPMRAGDVLVVPNAITRVTSKVRAVRVVVDIRDVPAVQAFDSVGTLVFHAPATVGAGAADSATSGATVAHIVWKPKYRYQPAMFGDRKPGARSLTFPSGPNSPVGSVWIGLNKKHVGLHGTAEPGRIGRDTSHGCVRLTNWDAARLASILKLGTHVEFRRAIQVADGPDAKTTNQSPPSR